MKTFTIDAENSITVFASKKEAAAASTTPFDPFTSLAELAELIAEWPMSRLVEVWNGIPGVTAVGKFTSRKVAVERIWKAIQGLGETPHVTPKQAEATPVASEAPAHLEPALEPIGEAVPVKQPQPDQLADAGAQAPDVASAATLSTQKATRPKKAPRAKKSAEPEDTAAPREGSKTARVVEMLKRPGGATLVEIMKKFGWQKHTVRGFMAGAIKKAGHTVESFKPEGGERTYRIPQ